MFTLSNITSEGFYFRKSNCEWVRPLPNPLPEGAIVTAVDMEALSLTYEVEGEPTTVVYTQEQVDEAAASITA